MSELQEVGRIVAALAEEAVPVVIRDDNVPSVNTRTEALSAIERVVTQSPKLQSERVWAGVFGILGLALGGIAAALMVPEAKEAFGPAAPIWAAMLGSVASGLAGVAALVSKATDPRPTR